MDDPPSGDKFSRLPRRLRRLFALIERGDQLSVPWWAVVMTGLLLLILHKLNEILEKLN